MNRSLQNIALAAKRLFDLLVSASVLFLFSPLLALIALAIKLDGGGPILFVQDRVGRGRRNFRGYKFRPMVLGAETIGSGFTVTANDARITRVGRLLRLWTLDEIPQLINVFKGEMSIVVTRPSRTVITTARLTHVLGFFTQEAVVNEINENEIFSRQRSVTIPMRQADLVV